MHSLEEVWQHLLSSSLSWLLGLIGIILVGLLVASLLIKRDQPRKLLVLDSAIGLTVVFLIILSCFVTLTFLSVYHPHLSDYLILGLTVTTLLTNLVAIGLALPVASRLQAGYRHRLILKVIDKDNSPPASLMESFQGLSHRFAVSAPPIYQVNSETPGAWILEGKEPILLYSHRLPELLDESELEATLAHELAHIKLDHMSNRSFWGRFSRSLLLNPFARMAFLAKCREREFQADRLAVEVTTKPLDLATALLKLARAWGQDPVGLLKGQSHALLSTGLLRKHPFIEERVQRLLELAGMADLNNILDRH